MRIDQEQIEFQPISVVLETKEEAEAFIEILDVAAPGTPKAKALLEELRDAIVEIEINFIEAKEYEKA